MLKLVTQMNRLSLDTCDLNPFDFEKYLEARREHFRYLHEQRKNNAEPEMDEEEKQVMDYVK